MLLDTIPQSMISGRYRGRLEGDVMKEGGARRFKFFSRRPVGQVEFGCVEELELRMFSFRGERAWRSASEDDAGIGVQSGGRVAESIGVSSASQV